MPGRRDRRTSGHRRRGSAVTPKPSPPDRGEELTCIPTSTSWSRANVDVLGSHEQRPFVVGAARVASGTEASSDATVFVHVGSQRLLRGDRTLRSRPSTQLQCRRTHGGHYGSV